MAIVEVRFQPKVMSPTRSVVSHVLVIIEIPLWRTHGISPRLALSLRDGSGGRFAAAANEQALRDENAKILGKKGELTAIPPPSGRRRIRKKAITRSTP